MVNNCCGQESYGDQPPRPDSRQQLIDEIKRLIGDVEKGERGRARDGGRRAGAPRAGGGGGVAVRDMDEECRQYRKRRDCTPPTITGISIHETRPTSDYSNMQHENTKQVTFVDATRTSGPDFNPMPPAPWELPRKPSQELRASTLYQNCECNKRNGLQQDCPRWDCSGRPECVAINPGPCCGPSQARKPVRGDRRDQQSPQALTSQTAKAYPAPQPPSSKKMALQESPRFTSVPGYDLQAMGIVQLVPPVGGVGATPQRLPTSRVERIPIGYTPSGTNMICLCRPAGPLAATPTGFPIMKQGFSPMPSSGKYICCPTT